MGRSTTIHAKPLTVSTRSVFPSGQKHATNFPALFSALAHLALVLFLLVVRGLFRTERSPAKPHGCPSAASGHRLLCDGSTTSLGAIQKAADGHFAQSDGRTRAGRGLGCLSWAGANDHRLCTKPYLPRRTKQPPAAESRQRRTGLVGARDVRIRLTAPVTKSASRNADRRCASCVHRTHSHECALPSLPWASHFSGPKAQSRGKISRRPGDGLCRRRLSGGVLGLEDVTLSTNRRNALYPQSPAHPQAAQALWAPRPVTATRTKSQR